METVHGLIDGLKSATYELTALLLPGVVLVALANVLVGTPEPGSLLVWIASGYTVGFVIQGLCSLILKTKYTRWLLGGVDPSKTPPSAAQVLAETKIGDELGAAVAKDNLLDIALTRVHPNRHVYDRFLALADTTRALTLVAVIAVGLVIYGMRSELDTRVPWFGFVAAAIAWSGLCERHRKFAPIAYKALYGKYVALSRRAPTADAHESTDDPTTSG